MELKRTITSIFMVPTLGINRSSLKTNGFINGYSKDAHRDVQYENCVYVLFKPSDLEAFRDFLDGEYERTKLIIDDYDYPDGYVVLVYELDKKYKRDFEFIRAGKYSKTSKDFQNLFPKTVKIIRNGYHKDEVALQHRIFNKTKDLKEYWEDKIDIQFDDDMELWDGYKEVNEILVIEKLKENV
jgi:hypothetical protein